MHCLILNVEKRSLSRNLGPYRIAHYLRELSWDAEVIDYAPHWTFDELVELTQSRVTTKTKFIGFSFLFSGWDPVVEKYAIWLKQTYPDIALISGSSDLPYAQISVDYHIWGFGERALEVLLRYLFSNGSQPQLREYSGVKVIDGTDYPAYPLPNYTVLYQERDFLEPWEFLSIETSRGCIFKCSFCTFSVLGVKEDHSTSAESFEQQLKSNYQQWGIKNYIIAEETFNDRTDKIAKFANVVNKLDFDPWFAGYIRLDLLTSRKEDKELLAGMNMLGHFYGIESFNHQTAKAVRKGMAPSKVKEGLLEAKQYFAKTGKYRGTISLILGAPYETKQSIMDSRQWLIDNWNDQAIAFYPLGIPKKGRESELTTTYAQHGYKEVGIEQLKERHDDQKNLQIVEQKSKRAMLWENQHMDIVEAFQLNDIYTKTTKEHNFKKSTYALAEFSGEQSTLEDKLTHTAKDVFKFRDQELQWYEKYKMKKLCWIE